VTKRKLINGFEWSSGIGGHSRKPFRRIAKRNATKKLRQQARDEEKKAHP
jgi:hypothetical protein